MNKKTQKILDNYLVKYNQKDFIKNDPISIPHLFTKKQDIEISAFFAAILAWGNRTTIINSCKKIIAAMDSAPHDFICNHQESDLQSLKGFVHRTFNYDDLLYFIYFFKKHYAKYNSLENAFVNNQNKFNFTMENRLNLFYDYFFSFEHLARTKKHVQKPEKKSACKRINLFMRWMVRKDANHVDFGIWNKIKMADLICPLDVHVLRAANHLNIIQHEKPSWNSAIELTSELKKLDPNDPVKYDFALFGWSLDNFS